MTHSSVFGNTNVVHQSVPYRRMRQMKHQPPACQNVSELMQNKCRVGLFHIHIVSCLVTDASELAVYRAAREPGVDGRARVCVFSL